MQDFTEAKKMGYGGNAAKPLVSCLSRPQKGSEALQMLKDGKDIEMPNNSVFPFLRWLESQIGNIQLDCGINRLNQGFTVLARRCR